MAVHDRRLDTAADTAASAAAGTVAAVEPDNTAAADTAAGTVAAVEPIHGGRSDAFVAEAEDEDERLGQGQVSQELVEPVELVETLSRTLAMLVVVPQGIGLPKQR